MGFADRMMRAEHGPLHKAEPAFGRVDMDETAKACIFVCAVIYRAVAGKLFADILIARQFVSCEIGFAACDLDDSFTKGLGLHVGDMEGMAVTVAVDKR